MEITDELIDHLAYLVRLDFQGNECDAIKADLANMLKMVEKMNELDTQGIEPLLFVTTEIDRVRVDIPTQDITKAEGLQNAPLRDADYFRVPRVVDKSEG